MITVKLENNKDIIKKLYCDNKIEFTSFSSAVIARDEDEILGYCLFDLEEKRIILHAIEPERDIMLADGILRSALHVAAERFIMNAYYSDNAPEELFQKLAFIEDKENKKLNIDKLFGGCHCDS